MAVPNDTPCLRFPENLAPQAHLTHETAFNMLLRAVQAATQMPFQWGWIDRPHDGSMYLIFLIAQHGFPQDGIRFQEQEQRYPISFPGGREMEVGETRYGYVPGADNVASRVRRRYRITKGGHLQLCLIHYTRGQAMPIAPGTQSQPVRMYPLRPLSDPAVFVMGEKVGQKVAPHRDPQALLANQNREMQELERRAQRDRAANMNQRPPAQAQAPPPPPQRVDEEDDLEDLEHISTRTLALTRYRRNHEFMSEIFVHAAFGEKNAITPVSPYSIFSESELNEKAEKLAAELEELKAKAAARKATKEEAERADVSMNIDFDVAIDVQLAP